jgi:hypothetical protein
MYINIGSDQGFIKGAKRIENVNFPLHVWRTVIKYPIKLDINKKDLNDSLQIKGAISIG